MFLQIKNIPKVPWSSEKPLNLKPKISTFFFLCFGLTLFGLGEGLLIVSASGASPWRVFAQGLYLNIGFSIGLMTILISIMVLLLWFPLKQKPGIGTIINALIISYFSLYEGFNEVLTLKIIIGAIMSFSGVAIVMMREPEEKKVLSSP